MKKQFRQRQTNMPIHLGEVCSTPSMTVPDDSYTVQDILERFTRGIDPMLTRNGSFDSEDHNSSLEDGEFDINPVHLVQDLTDVDDMKEFLKNTEIAKKLLLKKIEESKKAAENSAS